ncbi:MAG: tetratricopeptide repeat protein [candidate division WOR-3 bacterium]
METINLRIHGVSVSILLCFCLFISISESSSKECCNPRYVFAVLGGPKTIYEPKMTKERASFLGTPFPSRIAYGWEPLRVEFFVTFFIDSIPDKNCSVRVISEKDWFGSEVVSDVLWEPTPWILNSPKREDITTLHVDESIGVESEIMPKDSKGRPLEPGLYKIKVMCDMNKKANSFIGIDEECKKILQKDNVDGFDVFEIFRPDKPIEVAEEEMHKALYYGRRSDGKAIPHLKKVLEIDPDNYQALSELSKIYLRIGDFDNAKLLVDRCLKIMPNCRACMHYDYIIKNKSDPLGILKNK